jgi:hypothetical protein
VDDLVSTVDDHSQSWQLLLRVVSHIRILIDGKEFYEESEFPIVEFCAQAAAWLITGEESFLYVSMESDEDPLLGFRRDNEAVRVFSPHQVWPEEPTLPREVLKKGIGTPD